MNYILNGIIAPMSIQPIPGPRGRAILGMIPEMMSDMPGMFMDLTRTHVGIVQFKLFGKPYILAANPDYVKPILQDQYRHSCEGS